jgi:putative endonuclease
MATAYVYIMGSAAGVLYTGMTNDIEKRVFQHKHKVIAGFASKYSTTRLLFFEEFNHPIDAMAAEKRIKGWSRKKKLTLIRTINPKFQDLSEGWDADDPDSAPNA